MNLNTHKCKQCAQPSLVLGNGRCSSCIQRNRAAAFPRKTEALERKLPMKFGSVF
jgi:hypothetical protein